MKILSAFGLLLIFAACRNANPTSNETNNNEAENIVTLSAAQLKNTAIETAIPQQRNMSSLLKVTGKIDVPPQNMVSVSMPLGGYLKSTKLLPGMHISKGEVIASMEDQQYIQLQQDYLVTKSRLQYAQAEFNRQKELNEDKASSDKVYQQAQMEYNNTRIALKALAEKLQLIHINPNQLTENNLSKTVQIYSPINGFVSAVHVNIGKYVNPADILFELVNPADIHLNLTIFEKDLGKLSVGQKLEAFTNHQPEKKYSCEILLISQDITAERTAEVHCHFEEYDRALLPGMYMNAVIKTNSSNTMAIPDEAIVQFENHSYVFVALNNTQYQLVPADTGLSENGYTELKNSEMLDKKLLVIKGAYTLLMALKNKATDD
ncbi:MAG: hypothetical protein RL172_3060 [Bacteroidota bacterium]|jgi:membrane fusion protein, heavy metal efflux system